MTVPLAVHPSERTIDLRILAIDLGTTNAKAGIFDRTRLVASASGPIRTAFPGPGRAEQDPDAWLMTIATTVRDACERTGADAVDAIALTAQSDSLVVVGADGSAIGPSLLWMDDRGTSEAERFERDLGRPTIHQRTGLRSAANYTGPKAAWVKAAEADRFAQARWLMQPKDYLHLRLTGVAATDPSSASRTLLYDLDAGAWWPQGVAALGLSEAMLPPVVSSASTVGGLTPEAARLLGLTAGIPVVVGAADRAAEALGLGIGGEECMISTGTATGVALAVPLGERSGDDRITSPAHAVAGEALALLSIPTSGAILDWLAGITRSRGRDPIRSLTDLAATSEPGARGVSVVPTFHGARSFRWRSGARGAIVGLDLGASLADLARAVMEGIAFEVAACIEQLARSGTSVVRSRLTGGGFAGPFAAQLMADVTGRPAHRSSERDAALAGAMLLAGQALGGWDDPRAQAVARLGASQIFEPRPEAQAAYAVAAARYMDAVDAVLGLAERHASEDPALRQPR
ncbi:MAG: xylulokinase [Chloroflexota bacterium]|nr:xylulokinase [Chloroflexota bacterium]